MSEDSKNELKTINKPESKISEKIATNLKSEWSLFIQSFINEDDIELKKINQQLKFIKIEDVQEQIKELSHEKHMLFQKVEEIKSKIDDAQEMVEGLILVGADTQEIDKNIQNLNQVGIGFSVQLENIDKKIKKLRSLEKLAEDKAI